MSSSQRTRFGAHPFRRMGFVVFGVLVTLVAKAGAHPISVVVETAYVDREKVTIDVEVFAEDLYFYHDLKPNDRNEVPAESLLEAGSKHGALLLERLPVFNSAGRRLEGGKVISIEGNSFTEDVPLGQLMGYDLVYRLELPLDEPPEFLSFSQRLVDSTAGFPALVDFRVRQQGRDEEVEATLKPGSVRTVRFDWSDAATDPSDSDREAWLQAQREDSLGATALNTVRSFLYVTRREIRHELLIPFPLLESFFTIERAQPDFLSPNEQDAARPQVAEHFRDRNPLTIDGELRSPGTVRVEFFTLEDRDLTQPPRRRTVSAVNARVGVSLSYPLERPANDLKLVWKSFNREAWHVDAFCFAEDDVYRPKFSMATRTDTFEWRRPKAPEPLDVQIAAVPSTPTLSIPWLGLLIGTMGLGIGLSQRRRAAVAGGLIAASFAIAAAVWHAPRWNIPHPLAGHPAIAADEAHDTFRRLHHNLYLATKSGTDEEAIDALAAAADGELLRDLYLRLVRSFRETDESGTMPVADDVVILDGRTVGEPSTTGGFKYECRWEIIGRTEHWGHVHNRRYRYRATFDVEPRDGHWKLTAMDLQNAQVIEDNAIGLL